MIRKFTNQTVSRHYLENGITCKMKPLSTIATIFTIYSNFQHFPYFQNIRVSVCGVIFHSQDTFGTLGSIFNVFELTYFSYVKVVQLLYKRFLWVLWWWLLVSQYHILRRYTIIHRILMRFQLDYLNESSPLASSLKIKNCLTFKASPSTFIRHRICDCFECPFNGITEIYFFRRNFTLQHFYLSTIYDCLMNVLRNETLT